MRKVNCGQYDDSDNDDNENKNNPWRGKIIYNNWLVPSRLSWERREARGVRGSPLSSFPSPLALLSFLKRDDWGRVRYNNVDSAGWLHKVKDITVLVVTTKTSFTELDNKELHLCSGLSVTLQILTLSMASKRIGIPPSCLQKFLPSPVFSLQKMNTAWVLKKCNFFWNIPTWKTGLPFKKFRCSRNFSTGTTRKVVFYLLFKRIFPETVWKWLTIKDIFNTNLLWTGLWHLLFCCYLQVFLNYWFNGL